VDGELVASLRETLAAQGEAVLDVVIATGARERDDAVSRLAREVLRLRKVAGPFVRDAELDYMATNLLDALEQVPNTGDWHGAVRTWCEQHRTGRLKPNRTVTESAARR
jgi:hypothetical protein